MNGHLFEAPLALGPKHIDAPIAEPVDVRAPSRGSRLSRGGQRGLTLGRVDLQPLLQPGHEPLLGGQPAYRSSSLFFLIFG